MIYNLPRTDKNSSGGETWLINTNPDARDGKTNVVNFVSNNKSFSKIVFAEATKWNQKLYYDDTEVADTHGSSGYLFNEDAYRTVTFTESPTGDLLTWLEANATKQ